MLHRLLLCALVCGCSSTATRTDEISPALDAGSDVVSDAVSDRPTCALCDPICDETAWPTTDPARAYAMQDCATCKTACRDW